MRIVVEGASKLDGSYGQVNVRLAAALAALGMDVTLAPLDQSVRACREELLADGALSGEPFAVSNGDDLRADVRVRMIWPPVWRRPSDGSLLVVAQPWEYGSIPVAWLEGIAEVDAVWVPTAYVKAGYVQSGVDPAKVWIVPYGTDLVGCPGDRPARHDDELSVLFVGGGIFRKGVDLLVAALDRLADSPLSRLRLTIKETGYSSYYAGQSLVDQALAAAPRVAARTSLVREHLDRASVRDLYAASDLLVHPYRSEGFGLPVLEAMACGLPVLVTKGGATDDFCGPGEALFVDAQLTVQNRPFIGEDLTVDYPYHLTPDLDRLSSALGAILGGELDPAVTAAAALAQAGRFTWAEVARHSAAALAALRAGKTPTDRAATTARFVADLVADPAGAPWVPALSGLLALGDHTSAMQLATLAAASRPPAAELDGALGRVKALAATGIDLFSGARWRLDLAAAGWRQTGGAGHGEDACRATEVARSVTPYLAGCARVLVLGCGSGAIPPRAACRRRSGARRRRRPTPRLGPARRGLCNRGRSSSRGARPARRRPLRGCGGRPRARAPRARRGARGAELGGRASRGRRHRGDRHPRRDRR